MKNSKILYEGITFDDVLLIPGYSEVLPRETVLKTKLTKNHKTYLPRTNRVGPSASRNVVSISDRSLFVSRAILHLL